MVENSNKSKEPSNGEYVDIRKFIGVGSVNIVAVNPNNAKLRELGWNIPNTAEEPKYVITTQKDNVEKTSVRIRFMCKLMDFNEQPIVAMDFWISPDLAVNKEGTKCKIIDAYVRTAWATKDDIREHRIPQNSNGPASISDNYKAAHRGEEELCSFLFKYLNITPLKVFERKTNSFVPSKNPGRLTIDNWKALCSGVVREIVEDIAQEPDNRVKVIFGVRTTEDNKTYQTFLNTAYIGNGAVPDRSTGEYLTARKAIDKFFFEHQNSPYVFEATPVREWKETASEVKDNSEQPSVFDNTDTAQNESETQFEDDLPF